MDGPADRQLEIVDGGDVLFGVDEEPLPLEGDDLHIEGLFVRGDRLERVELIGLDIREDTDNGDHDDRDAPPDIFGDGVVDEVGVISGVFVVGAEPPREDEGQDIDGNDDQQHEGLDDQEEVALLEGDVPAGEDDRDVFLQEIHFKRLHH